MTTRLIEDGMRVVTMAFHSTSLTPGSTPYVTTLAERDAICRWLEDYFEFFLGKMGGRAMTPLQVYDRYKTA